MAHITRNNPKLTLEGAKAVLAAAEKRAEEIGLPKSKMILSAALLLEWLGLRHNKPAFVQACQAIQAAVDAALADGNARTGDLGGNGNTKSFADAVVRQVRNPELQAVASC